VTLYDCEIYPQRLYLAFLVKGKGTRTEKMDGDGERLGKKAREGKESGEGRKERIEDAK